MAVTALHDLLARMATDPEFAHDLQANPDDLTSRYGLSDTDAAVVLAARIDRSTARPRRLEERLSRSGFVFGADAMSAVADLGHPAGGDDGGGASDGDGGGGDQKGEHQDRSDHQQESRQQESEKQESRQESRQQESEKQEPKQESRQQESEKQEPKQESRQQESETQEPKQESRQQESEKQESRQQESAKQESRQPESEKQETRQQDAEKKVADRDAAAGNESGAQPVGQQGATTGQAGAQPAQPAATAAPPTTGDQQAEQQQKGVAAPSTADLHQAKLDQQQAKLDLRMAELDQHQDKAMPAQVEQQRSDTEQQTATMEHRRSEPAQSDAVMMRGDNPGPRPVSSVMSAVVGAVEASTSEPAAMMRGEHGPPTEAILHTLKQTVMPVAHHPVATLSVIPTGSMDGSQPTTGSTAPTTEAGKGDPAPRADQGSPVRAGTPGAPTLGTQPATVDVVETVQRIVHTDGTVTETTTHADGSTTEFTRMHNLSEHSTTTHTDGSQTLIASDDNGWSESVVSADGRQNTSTGVEMINGDISRIHITSGEVDGPTTTHFIDRSPGADLGQVVVDHPDGTRELLPVTQLVVPNPDGTTVLELRYGDGRVESFTYTDDRVIDHQITPPVPFLDVAGGVPTDCWRPLGMTDVVGILDSTDSTDTVIGPDGRGTQTVDVVRQPDGSVAPVPSTAGSAFPPANSGGQVGSDGTSIHWSDDGLGNRTEITLGPDGHGQQTVIHADGTTETVSVIRQPDGTLAPQFGQQAADLTTRFANEANGYGHVASINSTDYSQQLAGLATDLALDLRLGNGDQVVSLDYVRQGQIENVLGQFSRAVGGITDQYAPQLSAVTTMLEANAATIAARVPVEGADVSAQLAALTGGDATRTSELTAQSAQLANAMTGQLSDAANLYADVLRQLAQDIPPGYAQTYLDMAGQLSEAATRGTGLVGTLTTDATGLFGHFRGEANQLAADANDTVAQFARAAGQALPTGTLPGLDQAATVGQQAAGMALGFANQATTFANGAAGAAEGYAGQLSDVAHGLRSQIGELGDLAQQVKLDNLLNHLTGDVSSIAGQYAGQLTGVAGQLGGQAAELANLLPGTGGELATQLAELTGPTAELTNLLTGQASDLASRMTGDLSGVAGQYAEQLSQLAGQTVGPASQLLGQYADQLSQLAGRGTELIGGYADQASALFGQYQGQAAQLANQLTNGVQAQLTDMAGQAADEAKATAADLFKQYGGDATKYVGQVSDAVSYIDVTKVPQYASEIMANLEKNFGVEDLLNPNGGVIQAAQQSSLGYDMFNSATGNVLDAADQVLGDGAGKTIYDGIDTIYTINTIVASGTPVGWAVGAYNFVADGGLEKVADVASDAADIAENVVNEAGGWLGGAADTAYGYAGDAVDWIGGAAGTVGGAIADAGEAIGDGAEAVVDTVGEALPWNW